MKPNTIVSTIVFRRKGRIRELRVRTLLSATLAGFMVWSIPSLLSPESRLGVSHAHAGEFSAKGYHHCDWMGGSLRLPTSYELHFGRGSLGYGPVVVGSEFLQGLSLPGSKDPITAWLSLYSYVVPYANVRKARALFWSKYNTSPLCYVYAAGNNWLCYKQEREKEIPNRPARYLDVGAGIHILVSDEIPVDFRVGYLSGSIDPNASRRGTSSSAVYVSVGIALGGWLPHGVRATQRGSFQQARKEHTLSAYERFLDKYPEGELSERARKKIEELRLDERLYRRTKIAFQSDRDGYDDDIYVMNADGTGLTQLTDNPGDDKSPSWSPNGKKIAFHSDRDGNWEIYTMNADGSNVTRLTNNSASDAWPSWSPDGKKIVFTSGQEGGSPDGEIYVIDSDGRRLTRLTRNDAYDGLASWSPDGKKVVFTSRRDENLEIYVMNADGTAQERLTKNHVGDAFPSWSPDGRKIAFVSTSERGKRESQEIHVMKADGSKRRRLTKGGVSNTFFPSWSPDGRKIAFTRQIDSRHRKFEIYSMNADGSELTRLTKSPSEVVSHGPTRIIDFHGFPVEVSKYPPIHHTSSSMRPSWSPFPKNQHAVLAKRDLARTGRGPGALSRRQALPRVSPRGAYLVQVGAFTDLQAALEMKRKLERRAYPVSFSEIAVNGRISYRVRIGPYLTKDEAKGIGETLAREERLRVRIVKRRL